MIIDRTRPRLFMKVIFSTLILLVGSSFSPAKDPSALNPTQIQITEVAPDMAIKKRIRDVFDAVGGFDAIDITVQSGVVKLSGEVPNAKVKKDAISLSDRTDGVILTLDRLTEPTEITNQLAPGSRSDASC